MNLQENIRRILREVRVPRSERVELYRDNNIIVVVPLTHRALQKYAHQCQWCINSDLDEWEDYHKGKHAVIIQRNPKKPKIGIKYPIPSEIFTIEHYTDIDSIYNILGYRFSSNEERDDYMDEVTSNINNFATNIVYYSPSGSLYDQEDNYLPSYGYSISDIPNVTPEVIKIMDDYLQENEEMSLQESIKRIIKEETETKKVINISGYDLSKVKTEKKPIGEYPTSFYYKNGSTKQKTTAILEDGYVYIITRNNSGQKNILKLDKTQFESSLKENKDTPEPLEVISGPTSLKDKGSKQFLRLETLIKTQSKNNQLSSEIDLNEIPKIDLTTTMRGKSYVFDIWATYCGPCRKKINDIITPLHNELSSSGLSFFFYSVDNDIRQLKDYVDNNLNYGIHAFDNNEFKSEIFSVYNIQGIPRTYFVDKDGNMYTLPDTLQESKDLILKYL